MSDAMSDRAQALEAALRMLRNECHAIIAMSYDAIKDSAGYTNLKVWIARVEEADALLARAAPAGGVSPQPDAVHQHSVEWASFVCSRCCWTVPPYFCQFCGKPLKIEHMADQTEQTQIDPWKDVRPQQMRHGNGMLAGAYPQHAVDAARAADAAQIAALTAERDTLRAQLIEAEGELHAVDLVLAGRSAFDHITGRINKILCAINAAQVADPKAESVKVVELTATCDTLRARLADTDAAQQQIATLTEALTRLRDCDWTIGRGDRMDAVRDIARAALSPRPQDHTHE